MTLCPEQLKNGYCTRNGCRYNHSQFVCRDCGVVCSDPHNFEKHKQGRFHTRQMRGATYPPGVLTRHCAPCNREIAVGDSWDTHTRGRPHLRQLRFIRIEAAIEDGERDKHGITVTQGPIDFGTIDVNNARDGHTKDVLIQNSVSESRIYLVRARLSSQINGKRVSGFHLEERSDPIEITSRFSLHTPILTNLTYRGRYEDRLELHFEDRSLNKTFVITRQILAHVDHREDYEALKPIAPYVRKQWTPRRDEEDIVPGVKPEAFAQIKWVVPLAMAEIPRNLVRILANSDEKSIVDHLRRHFLPAQLEEASYGRHFRVLLHAEEYRSEQDLQKYDMESVELTKSQSGNMYFLRVPGLAEKRPSVIIGDRILVRPTGSDNRWFEGYVHVVQLYEVGLRFNHLFGFFRGQKYNVRFKLGRLPLRRQHQALDTVFHPSRVLFPNHRHVQDMARPDEVSEKRLRLFNKLIGENPPQLRAVTAIKQLPPGSLPFVVFGPPGTGKTVTIVESILQIHSTQPSTRILVCAPSNSAADLIAERLNVLSKLDLFRLNAPSRNVELLPRSLRKFSSQNDRNMFNVPPVEKLRTFRVIVSTLISASVPYAIGLPRGHFTHIFIDEAGQASEPEAMVPIKTMSGNETNIILSGDPKQLGPIIRSGPARALGLDVSYLDRLMKGDIYEPTSMDGLTVVKLIKNWRSHESILRFSNEHFYENDLQACGDPVVINSYLQADILSKKGFPIVFHSISGQDEREANSPSFFNRTEASQVKEYVQTLMGDRRVRITNDDIGIIAPYNAQCGKIRTLLRPIAPNIKVGSVEEFQGQERRVIIISLVRSSMDFVKFDVVHTLGFVANPRRFNVAITRAKALLIIVGDPSVLGLDPLWRAFLNYIHNNGGWTGKKIGWDPEADIREDGGYDKEIREEADREMSELIERMRGVGVGDEQDQMEGNFDRPWREDE